jgi:hypothetical protein
MPTTHHFSSEELIRSCPLPKSFYSHKSSTHKSLTIEAIKIEPLSSFLKNKKHIEYSDVERLIEMIGRQLHHLEVEQNKGISMFHLDDITVFHSSSSSSSSSSSIDSPTLVYFAITNEDNIYDIDDDNLMEITIPPLPLSSSHISKNIAFYSPEYKEFMSKKTIPYQLHFKSSYYSFGLLCAYCYVNRDINSKSPHDSKHFETLFAPIINTKIYWFLKHVLCENPSERRYICV